MTMKQKRLLLVLFGMLMSCQEISDPSEGVSSVSSSKISLKALVSKLSFARSSSSVTGYSLTSWGTFSSQQKSSSSQKVYYSSIGYSSYRLSSSSANIALSSSQNVLKEFVLNANELGSYGGVQWSSTDYAVVGVDSDIGIGGSSYMTSPLGTILGFCPKSLTECTPNWSIQDAKDGDQINLNFFIYNWIRLSNWTQFRAFAGFWIFPKVDPNEPGSAWFDRALSIGMTQQSVVTLRLQYTYGQKLKIKLFGDGMYPADPLQPAPEYTYQGKGYVETISIPLSQFVKPQNPKGYAYSSLSIKGIGLERVVESSPTQTTFPVSQSGPTSLSFHSIAISKIQ